jgi:hypothetical protein
MTCSLAYNLCAILARERISDVSLGTNPNVAVAVNFAAFLSNSIASCQSLKTITLDVTHIDAASFRQLMGAVYRSKTIITLTIVHGLTTSQLQIIEALFSRLDQRAMPLHTILKPDVLHVIASKRLVDLCKGTLTIAPFSAAAPSGPGKLNLPAARQQHPSPRVLAKLPVNKLAHAHVPADPTAKRRVVPLMLLPSPGSEAAPASTVDSIGSPPSFPPAAATGAAAFTGHTDENTGKTYSPPRFTSPISPPPPVLRNIPRNVPPLPLPPPARPRAPAAPRVAPSAPYQRVHVHHVQPTREAVDLHVPSRARPSGPHHRPVAPLPHCRPQRPAPAVPAVELPNAVDPAVTRCLQALAQRLEAFQAHMAHHDQLTARSSAGIREEMAGIMTQYRLVMHRVRAAAP